MLRRLDRARLQCGLAVEDEIRDAGDYLADFELDVRVVAPDDDREALTGDGTGDLLKGIRGGAGTKDGEQARRIVPEGDRFNGGLLELTHHCVELDEVRRRQRTLPA